MAAAQKNFHALPLLAKQNQIEPLIETSRRIYASHVAHQKHFRIVKVLR
jgi:hypothetical protein